MPILSLNPFPRAIAHIDGDAFFAPLTLLTLAIGTLWLWL